MICREKDSDQRGSECWTKGTDEKDLF